MRFSLRTLMLLFPALIVSYGLAYGCAVQADIARAARIHHTHHSETEQLRFLQREVEQEFETSKHAGMQKMLNDYFSGKRVMLPKQLTQNFIDGISKLDTWENPYRCVFVGQKLHFYSCGIDGVSHSEGNDPDDLNSWNRASNKFYSDRYQANEKVKRLVEALYILPVALGLVIGSWLFAKRFIVNKFCRPSGASDSSPT